MIALLCLNFTSRSQEFEKHYSEIEQLQEIIHEFMYERDSATDDRISEFILLFLEVDSIGRIKSVNLMNDDKNTGPVIKIIRNLTPYHLKEWISKEYRRKMIVMPVYCDGSIKTYLDYIGSSPVISFAECRIASSFNFVIPPQLFYVWPSSKITDASCK